MPIENITLEQAVEVLNRFHHRGSQVNWGISGGEGENDRCVYPYRIVDHGAELSEFEAIAIAERYLKLSSRDDLSRH
jgi:hypothetical protein